MSSASKKNRYALKGRRNALSFIYVGLCAVQMAILAAGLTMAFRMEANYAAQSAYGATLNNHQRAITEMRVLADSAAAPAVDVTQSAWGEEWSRIQYSSKLFIERVRKLHNEPALATCQGYLESLSTEMEQMVQQTDQAGQALSAGDKLLFRTHLFYADRAYARVHTLLGNVSEEISRAKDEALAQDTAMARRSRAILGWLSLAGLLLVVPATAYVRRLNKEISAFEAELQAERDALEERVAERTAELHAEIEERRNSEARLTRLIDSNIIGIMVRRVDGAIVDANNAFLQMIGFTREDLAAGLRWKQLTPPEFKALDDTALAEIEQTASFRPYEKEYFRKDGSRIPVMIGGVSTNADEALVLVFDLTERKKTQVELERLARIVESTDEAILSVSLDGRVLSWNRGAEGLYGYVADEMLGRAISNLLPAGCGGEFEIIRGVIESGKSLEGHDTAHLTKSGKQKPVSLTVSPLRDESGKLVGMSVIARDLTQTKKAQQLEEQLRQAQKLEAVGRLTGGVAHDFNNLLMVIISYTEMLQDHLAADDPLRRNTEQVLKAAGRATSLTRQMLAFSRKQVLLPQVLDMNTVVNDTAAMLKRLIGEDIELTSLLSKPLWAVKADPSQMMQILMNLCVNARDAMPKGGKLTIETQNVVIDAQMAGKHPSFSPGSYTMLAVSDTGTGMTKEVQERIFEPFYTTKEKGKGTGLGLSTVYGIVKQSGGHIWVYSEVGKGTSFKLYFPKEDKSATAVASPVSANAQGQGETILLVEDEASLRELARDYLRGNGYDVLHASNGQEALDLADRHVSPIHLLVTDVIMPKMGGPELAKALASRHPIATLYMSGYTDNAIADHDVFGSGMTFIQKPFSMYSLGAKVRAILDSPDNVRNHAQDRDYPAAGFFPSAPASSSTVVGAGKN